MNIPKGIEKKTVSITPRPVNGVNTFDLLATVATNAGVPTFRAGMAFATAHMALDIPLRSDPKTGMGWVTESEASALASAMLTLLTTER